MSECSPGNDSTRCRKGVGGAKGKARWMGEEDARAMFRYGRGTTWGKKEEEESAEQQAAEPRDKIDSRVWRINGPKQIVKVILCCGRYRDGNRPGRHGNAAGSFGGFNSQTDGRTYVRTPLQKRLVCEIVRGAARVQRTSPAKEVEGRGNRRKRGVRRRIRGRNAGGRGRGKAGRARTAADRVTARGTAGEGERKKGERLAATPHVCVSLRVAMVTLWRSLQ